ncbi:MAG TPA: SMP-30/gluconolactonase/LRE family protein [Phycisphaerae bacterium]|nr:SMP-30/gluconolactonase/LRE family protein [Phycisphaerae bacterium]
MSAKHQVEMVANYHCRCGEGPLWDERRQVLFWTDIPAGRLFRYDRVSDRHEPIYQGEPVGGFTLQEDGSLLLFGADRISRMGDDGRVEVLIDGIDAEMDRFNDVIADPQGRVYAGTMADNPQRGGLFRVDTDGSVRCLFRGTGCSNGMGFTPDRRGFYWTCSTTRRIFRFDYEEDTGDLANRVELITLSEAEATPDGMTLDAEGNIWSARWGGFGVYKFSPTGQQLEKIELPVEKVSSVMFGGADLDELYLTTAGGADDSDTPDGALFRVKLDVKGVVEFRSHMLMS